MASVTASPTDENTHTAHKRRVNELIFESLAAYPRDGEIAFFCECASETCFETVWLSLDDYETGRINPRWLVIRAGHRRQTAVGERRRPVPA